MIGFSCDRFDNCPADQLPALCLQLANHIVERFSSTTDWDQTIEQVIHELRGQGHDLWSLDEDDTLQIWCGNYVNPRVGGELLLCFRFPTEVEVTWKLNDQDRAPILITQGYANEDD